MENEGHLAGELLNLRENVESQTLPVCGIFAVDIADARCEHIDAEISDHLALLGVSNFAAADNAVLFTADGADFSLNGNALRMSESDYLLGLCDVLLNVVVRAVKHNGGETCLDALESAFIGAVVEVKSNGNGDSQLVYHAVDHADNGRKAAHILACAFGHAEDNGGVELLSGEKDCLCPLKVVDIELTDRVLAGLCIFEHLCCGN